MDLTASCQNSYIESLTLSAMVFGDGAFARQLGVDEVMTVGISLSLLSLCLVRIQ